MKSIFHYIIGMSLLLLSNIGTIYAQKNTRGTLSVKPTSGVENNSVSYFYKGEQRTYQVLFNPEAQADSLTEAKLFVNKTPIECKLDEKGRFVSFDTNALTCDVVSSDNKDSFILEYSYSSGKNEDGSPKIEEAQSNLIDISYVVYETPSNKTIVSVDGHKSVIGEKEFTITATGIEETTSTGNPDGWTYYWEIDGQKQQDAKEENTISKFFKYNGTSEYNDFPIRLCLENKLVENATPRTVASDYIYIRVYKPLQSQILDNPKNTVLGYSKKITVQLNGGQKGKWNKVTIGGFNAKHEGNDVYSIDYLASSEKVNQQVTLSVEAVNTPDDCNETPLEPASINLQVWSKPQIKNSTFRDAVKEIKGGSETLTLSVDTEDSGCQDKDTTRKNGWFFTWKKDGQVLTNITNNYFSVPNNPTTNDQGEYSLEAAHYVDGEKLAQEVYKQKVIVWAVPKSSQYLANAFHNEKPQIIVTPLTGYMGEDGGWKYSVKKGNETILEEVASNSFSFEETLTCPSNMEEYPNRDYTLIAQNYYKDNEKWGDEIEIPLTISVHAQPSVDIIYDSKTAVTSTEKIDKYVTTLVGSIDTYYDKNIEFIVNKNLGIDGYWNCSNLYYEDASTKVNANGDSNNIKTGETYKTINGSSIKNEATVVKQGKIKGYILNGYGSEIKKWNIDIDVNIWPQASWEGSFVLSQTGIREGDDFTVVAPTVRGGYCPNNATKVSYTYKVENQNFDSENNQYTFNSEHISSIYAGTGKHFEKREIGIVMHVLSPNGVEWDKKTYSKDVTIYRRPQMPESLVQKGNGTSHTYIITLPSSETSIEKDYNYVLTDGSTIYYNGKSRYAVANNSTGLKAACYWEYDKNVTIYSDFRLLESNLSETCDWSSFHGEGPISRGTYDDNDVEGINGVVLNDLPMASMYDMQGRRVMEPQRGRMYIVNGKKMIFK